MFLSDGRSRVHKRQPALAAPGAVAVGSQPGPLPRAGSEGTFEMLEHLDPDGTLRLTLLGDLDLEVADTLGGRLAELRTTGRPVRLDLSRLAFIDSSGVQALLGALTDARWHGWELEVAREVSPTVRRAAEIVGIAQVLWPPDDAERA